MKGFIAISVAYLLVAVVAGQDEQNSQGISLRQLPKDILQEAVMLMKGQSIVESVYCIDPKPKDIPMYLFTRTHKYDPIALDVFEPTPIGKDKPLIFITQGWLQEGKYGYGMEELKNSYLERYDANVVVVGWQKLSWDLYSRTVCKIPKMARIIADYLCQVSFESDLQLENVHLVGHSLGAQMFGFVGQFTQEMCQKRIGRITGLDPAGPLYNDAPTSKRLDESDANYVDVVHTNSKVFGYGQQTGHADFYVNCGIFQPSCMIPDIDINNLQNLPLSAVFCSHTRSIDYMTESVTTNNFVATKCNYCPIGCPPVINLISKSGKVTFGEHSPSETRGKYYVPTNFRTPYASGRA